MPTPRVSFAPWFLDSSATEGAVPSALVEGPYGVFQGVEGVGTSADTPLPRPFLEGVFGSGLVSGLFEREGNVRNTEADEAITGDADTHTIWFTGRADATVDLGLTTVQNTGYGNDTITGIHNATGGEGNDRLTGNTESNRLLGGKGNDTLLGLGGDDHLSGKRGEDSLVGGEGNDALYGGRGNDALAGDAGEDRLWGGTGNDTLVGGAGDDRLWGGTGQDTLTGGEGDDVLRGDSHQDNGWLGFLGGWEGFFHRETYENTPIQEETGHLVWRDLVGRFPGFAGPSTESADGTGAETPTERPFGLAGWFSTTTGTSAATMPATAFDDRLDGGNGDDRLWGGAGHDTLLGGAGDDTLTGGSGADRFVFMAEGGNDTVTDFSRSAGDRIVLDRALFDEGTTLEDVIADHATNSAAGVSITTQDGTIAVEGVHALTAADLAWA